MIEKVMFFSSDWNSTLDFYGVYYQSGKVLFFDTYKSLPETVRHFIAPLHTCNPTRDEKEGCYTFA